MEPFEGAWTRLRRGLPPLAVVLTLVAPVTPAAPAAEPSRADVLAAMKKATTFMTRKVALRGGYVWLVSEDLKRRWGEIPARPSQIWLQGGTERMGQVFLDAYEATGDAVYLDAARAAADALVSGQHPLGGWHYFIDFEPKGLARWYATRASRFRWGYEEFRHYYGNATLDDRVTADAGLYLLRFHRVTREAAYEAAARKALDFALAAQFPNGAWPQRFPLSDEYAHDGLPDYTSFYTLNDGAMLGIVDLLLDGFETFGDARYFDAARRAADALIALQGPAGQGAWAEQHGPDGRPIAARTHEPAGYVLRESLMSMAMLDEMYLRTGDARYLAPMPRCIEWLERVNREIAAAKYPRPRYWQPGTNAPLYVVRTAERTPAGYGKYLWTTDPARARCDGGPCTRDGKPVIDTAPLRARYAALRAMDAPARAAGLEQRRRRPQRAPREKMNAAQVIAALDARGAWVTDDHDVPVPDARSDDTAHERVRGIATAVFADRMAVLISSLRAKP